jgi:beta-galactosidase
MDWSIYRDGSKYMSGKVNNIIIEPHESREVQLDYTLPQTASAEFYLNISFVQKYDTPWEKSGYEVAFEQFKLPVSLELTPPVPVDSMPELEISEDKHVIVITGEDFEYSFNKFYGSFESIKSNGVQMITSIPKVSIWRAPIDNDRNIKESWRNDRLDTAFTHVYGSGIVGKAKNYIRIKTEYAHGGKVIEPALKGSTLYTIYGNGEIDVTMSADIRENLMSLPRFGLEFAMPRGNETINYFGMGPHENYIDMNNSAKMGLYESTVDHEYEPYIKPQETGNHTKVQWAAVYDIMGRGLIFKGNPEFNFSALHYTPEDLDKADYTANLNRREETIVHVDYQQTGIGSNSCGPNLQEKYELKPQHIDFGFSFKPIWIENLPPYLEAKLRCENIK